MRLMLPWGRFYVGLQALCELCKMWFSLWNTFRGNV